MWNFNMMGFLEEHAENNENIFWNIKDIHFIANFGTNIFNK